MKKNRISEQEQIEEFLSESNAIEREYSDESLEDAKKAWDYAYKNRKDITLAYILEIHRLLLQRLNPDIAGKVRDCAVMIGWSTKEKKPEKILLAELQTWIDNCKKTEKSKKITEKDVKNFHIFYENAHVHRDGNGRVGRILWQIQRINNGLPIKIIYEAEKLKYYQWFHE